MGSVVLWVVMVIAAAVVPAARAEIFGGVEFPAGGASFADVARRYDPHFGGGDGPTDPDFMDSRVAVGAPDYSGGSGGTGAVSLGSGGVLELAFVDNLLTNSGTATPDLHIFEVGPQVEDTFVGIRPADAATRLALGSRCTDSPANPIHGSYCEVGSVRGSISHVDIDAFFPGAPVGTLKFDAVQLIDDKTKDGTSGPTVGADIDAVGAIASAPPPPPTTTTSTSTSTTTSSRPTTTSTSTSSSTTTSTTASSTSSTTKPTTTTTSSSTSTTTTTAARPTTTSTSTSSSLTSSSTTSTSTSTSSTSSTAAPPSTSTSTTTTCHPAASSTTSTTLAKALEDCGNCIDDDGDGDVDGQDSDCCRADLDLHLGRGLLRAAPGNAGRLMIKGLLAGDPIATVDPTHEDLVLTLEGPDGGPYCARVAAASFAHKRRTYVFIDANHAVAAAQHLDRVWIRRRADGTFSLTLYSNDLPFDRQTPGDVRITLGFLHESAAFQAHCADVTLPFDRRGTSPSGGLHYRRAKKGK